MKEQIKEQIKLITFQEIVSKLNQFWSAKGCVLQNSYDLEKGASTMNPATFLRSLGPEPWKLACIEACRRPTDGRYGENPNRLQHYFQYQVIIKPSSEDIQEVYLESLENLGIDYRSHDLRFVEDNWESPTLGAWGLGWEVWLNGMEITQFTYFQQVGGLVAKPVSVEITYGLERLAMYLQNKESVYQIAWNEQVTYGEIYHRAEFEWSKYNFESAGIDFLKESFVNFYQEAEETLSSKLVLPAYDLILKCSHLFNLIDARGALSKEQRKIYILKIRKLANQVAKLYLEQRKELGFPLKKVFKTE